MSIEELVEVGQVDRNRAETVCSKVFIQTRHQCILEIERARDLIDQTSLMEDYPQLAERLKNVIDGVLLNVTDGALIDPEWIEEAAQAFARHRATALSTLQAENERLRKEAEDLGQNAADWIRRHDDLAANFEALQAENKRLREALEYYGDEARWRASSGGVTPAFDDKGYRARTALEE